MPKRAKNCLKMLNDIQESKSFRVTILSKFLSVDKAQFFMSRVGTVIRKLSST